MAYTDFTLEWVESELGVGQRLGPVFPALTDIAPPLWLADQFTRGMQPALISEKARSEFIGLRLRDDRRKLAIPPV